jgi:choline dehydrogenase-like flavoprotein
VLVDAKDVPRDSLLEADVLVIGAGAAGITLARAFSGTRATTLVLEGGGFEYEDETQELAHGLSDDYPVDLTRLRYFGGTTNHWGGWCRALDPWVFGRRPWVADVGWPIGPADLAPWYRQAAAVVELPTGPAGWTWEWAYWRTQLRRWGFGLLPDNDVTTGTVFRFSPPTRFGTKYRAELSSAPNVQVVLHANALELRTDAAAARVTEVPVATLAGNRFRARGRFVVLAVGGLEAPRLLLLSDSTHTAGLGNDHDLVGRYFMDHIEGSVGTLEIDALPGAYMGGVFGNARAMIGLTPALMAREQLLACAVTFDADPKLGVGKYADDDSGVTAGDVGALRTALDGGSSHAADVVLRAEPKPLPDSRVVLSGERDALGQRRLELRYARSPDIESSIRRTLELVARELGRAGVGRLRVDLDDTDRTRFEVPTIGFHLMGTTRMAADPRQGVVDADLRVHGTDNLYVASSSVFPTVGYSNPTLTIVALTLRLAAHLAGRLR